MNEECVYQRGPFTQTTCTIFSCQMFATMASNVTKRNQGGAAVH